MFTLRQYVNWIFFITLNFNETKVLIFEAHSSSAPIIKARSHCIFEGRHRLCHRDSFKMLILLRRYVC